MKFDVIIGNPPYQEETLRTSDKPVYHLFMQEAYKLADKVCLITPARFLFEAGKTPRAWNQEMLADLHLKVVYYEEDSSKVFPGIVEIKGGIAITLRDIKENSGAIKAFIPSQSMRGILEKVKSKSKASFSTLIFAPESYKFSNAMHTQHPEAVGLLSNGHKYDVTTNIFEKLGFLFYDEEPINSTDEYIQIFGRKNNNRLQKWIKRSYINEHPNLDYYKVFLPKSSGSGIFGEELSTPIIGNRGVGHTQTFISIGRFDTKFEAESTIKYLKSKFARSLLGTLKVTQDNKKGAWKNVPLQDFTSDSDIDWTKPISEIDQQLYKKYNLTQEEIDFIESRVRPME